MEMMIIDRMILTRWFSSLLGVEVVAVLELRLNLMIWISIEGGFLLLVSGLNLLVAFLFVKCRDRKSVV